MDVLLLFILCKIVMNRTVSPMDCLASRTSIFCFREPEIVCVDICKSTILLLLSPSISFVLLLTNTLTLPLIQTPHKRRCLIAWVSDFITGYKIRKGLVLHNELATVRRGTMKSLKGGNVTPNLDVCKCPNQCRPLHQRNNYFNKYSSVCNLGSFT